MSADYVVLFGLLVFVVTVIRVLAPAMLHSINNSTSTTHQNELLVKGLWTQRNNVVMWRWLFASAAIIIVGLVQSHHH